MGNLTNKERAIATVYDHDFLMGDYLMIKFLRSIEGYKFGDVEKALENATYYYQFGVALTYLLAPYFQNQNMSGRDILRYIKDQIFAHTDSQYPDVDFHHNDELVGNYYETFAAPKVDLERFVDAFGAVQSGDKVLSAFIYKAGRYSGVVEIDGIVMRNGQQSIDAIKSWTSAILDERLSVSIYPGHEISILHGTLLDDQIKNQYLLGVGTGLEYEQVETVSEHAAVDDGVRVLKRPDMKAGDEHRILLEHDFTSRVVQAKGRITKRDSDD